MRAGAQEPDTVSGVGNVEDCVRWGDIFQAVGQPTLILDPDRIIMDANQAAIKAIGKPQEDIIGLKCYEIMHNGKPPPDCCPATRLLKSGTIETQDMEVEALNGTYLISCTPVFRDGGELHRIIHIATDITQQKREQEEKRVLESYLRQQQKLESMGVLAGGVAHEINNPIMGIMNYAQLIKDRPSDVDSCRSFATEIIKESERVATIVRRLLSFARQDSNPECQSVSLASIMDDTLSLIGTLLRRDHIDLSVSLAPDLPFLRCRPQPIQQVLMNLLTNTRDSLNERYPAHHENKRVSITSSLLIEEDRRWVRTTVEDFGVGISREVGERLFDPFFSTKPMHIGSGLGLAISYGIICEHQGRLLWDSEPEGSTRFYMDLPVADDGDTSPRSCSATE